MFKKIISLFLVIATVFSFSTISLATNEDDSTNDNTSQVDFNELKNELVDTLINFAGNVNSSIRNEVEKVITNRLIKYISSASGLSDSTATFIIENALKLAGIDGILHINAEKATKFVDFMFDNFGKYLPENSKVLADIYIWLASDQFGDWLNNISDDVESGNIDEPEEPEKGAFDKMIETIVFITTKMVVFVTSFLSHLIPLVQTPVEDPAV